MSFANPEALTSDGRTFTKWTKKELALLRKLHPNTPDLEIAKRLGTKTIGSVKSKAWYLGLKKSVKRLRRMGSENVAKRGDRQ